jgi:hypothetical protein
MEERRLGDAYLAGQRRGAEAIRAIAPENGDGGVDDGGAGVATGHGAKVILTDRSVNTCL